MVKRFTVSYIAREHTICFAASTKQTGDRFHRVGTKKHRNNRNYEFLEINFNTLNSLIAHTRMRKN